jgi:hypothetical protein
MGAAAVIFLKQNRIIRRYRDARATDSLHACCPEELGLRRSWIFERLIDRGVIVPVADGRCFLDVDAAQRFRAYRRRRALFVVALLIFFFIVVIAST